MFYYNPNPKHYNNTISWMDIYMDILKCVDYKKILAFVHHDKNIINKKMITIMIHYVLKWNSTNKSVHMVIPILMQQFYWSFETLETTLMVSSRDGVIVAAVTFKRLQA